MDHLKVLFITAWYPTKEQSVKGIFVREQAKAVRLYDDVAVLHCAGPGSNLKKIWQIEQENDERLTEGIPTFRVRYRNSPIPKTSYFVYLWSVFKGYRSIVHNGFQPDVIHAHYFGAGFFAAVIGKIDRIPVVVTEHFTGFPRKILGKLDLWRAHLAFKWADIVMPVSKSLQRAIEEYGIKARFQVVPNVVDTHLFHPHYSPQPKSSLRRLLVVCLFDSSHKKGVPYLLHALGQLRGERNDWCLDIVGDGPARPEYEKLTVELGLSDKVTFHGLKSKKEVAEFMCGADLFVLPSLFETFAVAAAEALAAGTPVLATRCGGPEEFITDDVGMLVAPGDEDALYRGLDHMLNHLERYSPEYIQRYANERFSAERVGEQLHANYLACLTKRRSHDEVTQKVRTHL